MRVLQFFRRSNGLLERKTRVKTYPFGYIQNRALSDSKIIDSNDTVLPVLIVGGGPVGLVLSILLTKLGIKCSVLEKNKAFSKHPQAHFINNRSMEVFRKLDGLAEEIERSQPPVELWRKFIYCRSLTGSILGSVDQMQPQEIRDETTTYTYHFMTSFAFKGLWHDLEKVVSPVSVAHFSQYKLVGLLLKQLEKLNFIVFSSEDSESLHKDFHRGKKILMGHECVSINDTEQCMNVTTSFLKEGKHMERNIRCNILIGTDGAGSTVRKLAGIELRGEQDLQKLVSVHFLSRDLGDYLLNERPGMLFFIFNTEVIGVLVAHDLKQGEFVLQLPFFPPQQKLEDFSPEICKKLIIKLVGRELSNVNVLDVKPWVMNAEVAEKYVCCDSRIILAGDAAHRFPPAGGFGMNTGIQDAHNLAWKIASVVKGLAPPSILQTYETERKQIAIFNTALSVQNFKAAMAVPSALGLDPTVANSVHQIMNKAVGPILPSVIQRAVLDGIFKVGRAQLSESFLNESNPLGSSRLAKLRRVFEEGKSLRLQFPAEDLGFRYVKGALVPDGDCEVGALEEPTGRRRDYVPSADPGSKMPHMNVRVLSTSSSREVISTLDLVSGEKIEFLLIIAPLEASYDLSRAAFKVADDFKVSIRVCVMWPAGTIKEVHIRSKAALAPWENYIDVMEVKRSSNSLSWWSICQMTDKGAILVRPDDHIAWRVKSGVIENPDLEMKRVFSAVLGSTASQC
ncbi:hypothetical protein Ddye_031508 [Dipteronia dyeriana]|uniref:FAD-binding domain-containing protein n=1 Tax=Dipteronia dyeriana TaxID=168575 RepID=A0AAD9TIN8_9ROSI|nr:hypothetical protein Ddye_031508 [Dipteronia dyeriana]